MNNFCIKQSRDREGLDGTALPRLPLDPVLSMREIRAQMVDRFR